MNFPPPLTVWMARKSSKSATMIPRPPQIERQLDELAHPGKTADFVRQDGLGHLVPPVIGFSIRLLSKQIPGVSGNIFF